MYSGLEAGQRDQGEGGGGRGQFTAIEGTMILALAKSIPNEVVMHMRPPAHILFASEASEPF